VFTRGGRKVNVATDPDPLKNQPQAEQAVGRCLLSGSAAGGRLQQEPRPHRPQEFTTRAWKKPTRKFFLKKL